MKDNAKLITFGCSFTASPINVEYVKYYKKTDNDVIWNEHVASSLGVELINYGIGGASNDTILDLIIDVYDTVGENDVIIIGASFFHRFDIPNRIDNCLVTLSPNPSNIIQDIYSKDDIEKISLVTLLMSDDLFKQRYLKRFNFIANILENDKKAKKCLIWNVEDVYRNFEIIEEATNGKLTDQHWSFKGHVDFSKYILNKL